MSTLLSANQLLFCQQFPGGRLCRFVNRLSGTLLDIQPNMTMVEDKVPQVVGNADTAATGVQYWIIIPHGDGQAIIPVPKDGSSTLRYLSASSINTGTAITVSPFPVTWIIYPTSDCPQAAPGVAITTPPGLVEQWTVQVCWPHFRNTDPRMLDLWAGLTTPNTNAVLYPYSGSQQQFWLLQFLPYPSSS